MSVAAGQTARPSRRRLWTPLRIVLGATFVLIGLPGLAVPVIPGWVFLVPGVLMLAPRTRLSRWIRRQGRRFRPRRRKVRA